MSVRHASTRRVTRACVLALIMVIGAAAATTAQAADLMDVYRQALQSDPVLQQAEAQHRIGKEGVAQSRAVLLPQINAQATYADSHGTQTTFIPGPNSHSNTGGRSVSQSIGLNQVLFDLGDFARLKASKSNAASTGAELEAARQDLILRVAQTYFTVLTDEQNLKFAKANKKALKKQLDQAQAKYQVGFAAITDVADAKAQYDSAVASVINAENAVFNDRQALAQITGQPVKSLAPLAEKLPLQPPQPDDMDTWVKTALAKNPSLAAQQDLVEAAGHSVTAARAARLPTLNASLSYTRNPTWDFPGRSDQRTTDTTVGLVLDVPLFAGGATQSLVRQGIAERDKAGDVLEQVRRNVVSNTRNAFNAIKAGISSVRAQQQAVVSAKTALDGTRAGYDIGTQTIVNLLIAQENYFQARSALAQARHALVVNKLNLKFAAGTLSVHDLEGVNALLRR